MTRLPSVPKPLIWALAATTAALYAVLAYGSYVTVPSLAGGVLGFDMRPMGMPVEVGQLYLQNMTSAAKDYYSGRLWPLDTAFIAALVTLVIVVSTRIGGRLCMVTAMLAMGYGIVDFQENRLVLEAMQLSVDVSVLAYLNAIRWITSLKFVALLLVGASLITQWRYTHAQR